jgi:hypothetical protein
MASVECPEQATARRTGGDCVAPQSCIDPFDSASNGLDMLLSTTSPARTALPAAHFDRNATAPFTDLVQWLQPISTNLMRDPSMERMAFVPEGQADRSQARSAWESVPRKNRPVGCGMIGRS